jgi:4,4'-diaponeurosporenoate glycosyltransferase
MCDLSVAYVLLAYPLGFYLMWKIPSFARHEQDAAKEKDRPPLSVIIPARNERERIAPLLESLQQQTVHPCEILVVDDHSSDGTSSVAGALGATVIQSNALPEGWTGKTWACWQGAQHAIGELLVFLDADVRLEHDGLACLVDAYGGKGGLLTVQPYHVTRKPYEELSAVFNIVLMAGMNAFTLQGEAFVPSGGFGPCAVCNREDYIETGGHGHPAVRGNVLESIPLTRVFLGHDLPVRCYGGRGAVTFRMYPGGPGELVEGWSKGFGSGALATRPIILLAIVAWISACFSTFVTLISGLVSPSTSPVGMYALLYVLYALQIWWMLRRIGSFRWWTAALFPLPLCFFALVMLRSFLLIHLLRRVQWRGRAVPTARGRSK